MYINRHRTHDINRHRTHDKTAHSKIGYIAQHS
jgi:hypothetical protein